MDPEDASVKSRRRYDASARRDSALRNRAAITAVARELFLRDGYAGTTVVGIARGAGVSPETVYKAFGGKPGIVREIQRTALSGSGSVPAPDMSDELTARETNPAVILRGWADLTSQVAPLVAPVMLLVRAAAATDVEMAALRDEMERQRSDRMAHNARRLRRRGGLRRGLRIGRARDVMLAYTAPELYELLVMRQGWNAADFGDFVYRGLCAELLGYVPVEKTDRVGQRQARPGANDAPHDAGD